MAPQIIVRVAQALALAEQPAASDGDEAWERLTVEEQTSYAARAKVAVEAYLEAVTDQRID